MEAELQYFFFNDPSDFFRRKNHILFTAFCFQQQLKRENLMIYVELEKEIILERENYQVALLKK